MEWLYSLLNVGVNIILILLPLFVSVWALGVIIGVWSPWWSSEGSLSMKQILSFLFLPVRLLFTIIRWIFETLIGLFNGSFDFGSLFGGKKKCSGSKWMSAWKQTGLGIFGGYISSNNTGFVVDGSGKKRLSLDTSTKNMLVISRSGGGKSTRVLLPSVLGLSENTVPPSQVITDLSGELWEKSTPYLKKQGTRCIKLDFENPKESFGFNVFRYLQTTSDIKEFLDTLFLGSKDPFWDNSAKSMLHFAISLIKRHDDIKENFASLMEVIDELAARNEEIDEYVVETQDDDLYRKYKALLAMDDKTYSGVVASARAVLERFDNESMMEILDPQKEQIDIKDLRDTATALFVTVSETRYGIFAPLLNVFFGVLFRELAKYDQGLPVFCMMDEFAQLNINGFAQIATTSRKRKIALMILLQDYAQLVHVFGDNAPTIYKGAIGTELAISLEFSYAKKISERIGMVECDGQKKPLMSPHQLVQMDETEAVLLSGNKKPIYLQNCKAYYDVKRWVLTEKKKK